MPAGLQDRPNAAHAASNATIALAGIREIAQGTIAASNGSADDDYTVANPETNRVILFHLATNDDDMRFSMDGSAVATDMPLKSGVYFVVEAYMDDVISVYNDSGGAQTVYVMEVY